MEGMKTDGDDTMINSRGGNSYGIVNSFSKDPKVNKPALFQPTYHGGMNSDL